MEFEPTETTFALQPDPGDTADPSSGPGGQRRELRNAVLLAVAFIALYVVTSFAPFTNIVAIGLSTLTALVISLAFTVQVARSAQSARAVAISLAVSALLILPSVVTPIAVTRFPGWHGWASLAPRYGNYVRLLNLVPGERMLLLVWFAASIGALVSRLVRETKILLPMAIALALVDLYVVFGGGLVTQAAAPAGNHTAKVAMQSLTVKMPVKIPSRGASPMNLSVGVADYLFVALFFASFARFGIRSGRTFVVLAITLAGYMLVVFFTGISLPALVPIALVVIGMNLRHFRYERSEAFALLYAGLLVAAILGGLVFMSRR